MSDQNGGLKGHMSFQVRRIISSTSFLMIIILDQLVSFDINHLINSFKLILQVCGIKAIALVHCLVSLKHLYFYKKSIPHDHYFGSTHFIWQFIIINFNKFLQINSPNLWKQSILFNVWCHWKANISTVHVNRFWLIV